MAKVQQMICDRCGSPIKNEPEDARNKLTRFDKDYHGTGVDLCRACSKAFTDWLDNPTTAPPGYKWKPRPCPHHVPCADPTGCSGQELVPM